MLRKSAYVVVVLALLLGMSSAAFAQKTTVLRVILVKSDNMGAYLEALGKGTELMKKLGVTPHLRVWQATFAGPNTGTVVVTLEYPSMMAYAADMEKLSSDKEFQAWTKSLDKLRTITSDSLFKEL